MLCDADVNTFQKFYENFNDSYVISSDPDQSANMHK